ARNALLNMIEHLTERGWTRQQAYVICSVAVDLKLSALVDVPNMLVSAFLPAAIFVSWPRCAARVRSRSDAGPAAGPGDPGQPVDRLPDRVDLALQLDQPDALLLVRGHRLLDDVRRQRGRAAAGVPAQRPPALPGRLQAGRGLAAGEPGEQHRVAAQHVVPAPVPRHLIQQPGHRGQLPVGGAGPVHVRRPPGRHLGHAGSSSATVSTCWVIGKQSNARSRATRQPASTAARRSRASDAGSQDTYATARGRNASSAVSTSGPAPARGGSSTATSGTIPTPPSNPALTRPVRTSTAAPPSAAARLVRASAAACGSASTASTWPDGPTAAASRPANSPAPAYRSSAVSPGAGARKSSTQAERASAAAGRSEERRVGKEWRSR